MWWQQGLIQKARVGDEDWGEESGSKAPRPRRRRRRGVADEEGFLSVNRGYGDRREFHSGVRVEPRPKTDFSAFQASRNALRWDVRRKFTSSQKMLFDGKT